MKELVNAVNADTGALVLSPDSMKSISDFAKIMSEGTVMIPEHLQKKPADCMAIVIQSMQWNMNPYSVAQKTHIVSGTLGYEAQLVNAVISSSTAIQGRFHYDYSEGWDALAGKVAIEEVSKKGRNGAYKVEKPVAKWTSQDEQSLWVRVGATLKGEDEIQWGEKLFLSSVLTRNSPLWVTAPKQQSSYLALKYWNRLYCPAVLLGVYTTDELQDSPREEKDITDKAESAIVRPAKTKKEYDHVWEGKQTGADPELSEDAVIVEETPVDAEFVEEPKGVKLIPVNELLEMVATTDSIDDMETIKLKMADYPADSEDRAMMVGVWKEKRAIILRAQDAAKLAEKGK